MFPLIICISLISLTWATKPCTLLTSCAVEKCLDRMQLCSIELGDYCTIVCQNVHCKARRESGRGRWSPSTGQVDKIMKSSSREEIFGNLVEKFDLVCIAAKCQSACQQCQACHYALEQMSALAQGEKTSGLCPKLESCAESCLVGDLPKVLSCIANRCNVHCYDGDCPSCKTISKRMFTMICTRHGMTQLPNINYDGTCPNFFNELSEEYVARRRRIAAQ